MRRVGEQFGQRVAARLAASAPPPSPGAAGPDATGPDSTKPDSTKPGTTKPGTTKPDTTEPRDGDPAAPEQEPTSALTPAPEQEQEQEPTRDRLERILLATLPLDDESRPLYLVYNQYFALALTEPALAAQPYTSDVGALDAWLVDQLRACQARGQLAPTAVLADEATALLALTTGLGNAVLAGTRSPGDARRVLARHLDRLLGPSAGGARPAI
ncbi:TetR family transcriptional regulator C-terminal domain-containing protein [Frankia sp. CN6]|uniref:TetR family transcriptional regulator C-terminal domain-containing protein n=1 Tax=Frankia nepalensis TaxID=1836974 RepID=A0A937R9M4_9ACTN|nr:TetR family transcriptional regulator C-terminal domain-containing protein [Frankia nepalensis]